MNRRARGRSGRTGPSFRVLNGARRAAVAAALTVVLLPSALGTAWAQAPSAEGVAHAVEMKKQADALMDDGKFADALARYEEAYAISADPALLYNEGRALQAMGDYSRAYAQLDLFARTAPPDIKALVPALSDLLADLRARVAKLVISCNIPGARVLVRDQPVGALHGKTSIPVRAGKAVVEILADGYVPFRTEMELPGGGDVPLDVVLHEKNAKALLTVNAVPPGSTLVLDGTSMGPVPYDASVAPGAHDVVLHHSGFVDARLPLFLGPGEHRTLDLKLDSPPAIYARWWFWAGIGAVVVTGVVVTAALLTDKPAGTGTFSPGQVRGPLMLSF